METWNSLRVKPIPESIVQIADFLTEEMEKHNISLKASNKISIAMDEMCSNVILYGKAKEVCVSYKIENQVIHLRIRDNGIPFNPLEQPDPNVTSSLEEREIGGLGIFMAKSLMDSITYERIDNHNNVYMELKL